MPSRSSAVTIACAFFAICIRFATANVMASTFDGVVKFYSKTYYRDRLLTINLNYPNQCYNIDCSSLDNKVESAKWSGIPTTGKAYIIFYEDFNCGGYSTTVTLPHFGGIVDFDVQKVKGLISAFKIKVDGYSTDNGFSNVCSWKGASVAGGSVSQDDSISMVVKASALRARI
jgi:hypothetical protein